MVCVILNKVRLKRKKEIVKFMSEWEVTSKLPIFLYICQLFLYHLIALLNFLTFWYDSATSRYESASFCLSQSSLAIFFFSFANSQC